MKTTSRRKSEGFYRRLLAEQTRSGLSLRAFAAERGFPAGTLSWWRHEFKRLDAKRGVGAVEPLQFVPVRVVDGPAQEPTASPREVRSRAKSVASSYEVVLGRGRVLRLPPDFDGARVAALVRAVEASC